MSGFDRVSLVLPPLWEKVDAWKQAIAQSFEPDTSIVQAQWRLVQALRKAGPLAVSPELAAWLLIWSRCFNLCEAVLAARERPTGVALHVFNRAAFEAVLQLQVIVELPQDMQDDRFDESTLRSLVIDRLRAYAAWCLTYDERYYQSLLDPDYLKSVYDPEPDRNFIAQLGANRAKYEAVFGPIVEVSDEEATLEMQQAAERTNLRLQTIRAWLNDRRLEPWRTKIRDLEARNPRRRREVAFYELFDDKQSSVRQRLKETGRLAHYVEYQTASRVLHGSTLDSFAIANSEVLVPAFADIKEECDHLARRIAAQMRNGAMLIELMLRLIESDQPNSQ
jgi:hypothetical protein